jgi:hypothetical protein
VLPFASRNVVCCSATLVTMVSTVPMISSSTTARPVAATSASAWAILTRGQEPVPAAGGRAATALPDEGADQRGCLQVVVLGRVLINADGRDRHEGDGNCLRVLGEIYFSRSIID